MMNFEGSSLSTLTHWLGRHTRKYHFMILLVVGILTFFVNSRYLLPDIMESRNLVTAHEMVTDGHWLIPTMNGELRLEKPPLPTWLAALTEQYVSNSLAALRFVPGLMGLLFLFYFYRLAHSLTRQTHYALTASLILCTCYNFVLMGRTATWDIYCHAWMMMGIYYLYQLRHGNGARLSAFLAGLALGLSFMSKGPVSFYALLLPYLIADLIWLRPSGPKLAARKTPAQWGVALLILLLTMLVVGGWWYGYVAHFKASEGIGVIAKESGSWMNRNTRPWYYYSTFFVEMGAWALLVVYSFLLPLWRKRIPGFRRNYLFTFGWMIACVVLLSLLPEKKTRYLLPVLVPAALTVAHQIEYWIALGRSGHRIPRTDYRLFGLHCALLALAGLAAIVFLWKLFGSSVSPVELSALTVCLLLAVLLLLYAWRHFRANCMLWAVVWLFAVVEAFGMPLISRTFCNEGYRSLGLLQNDPRSQALPLYRHAGESLRIEMVYDAGCVIRPLNPNDSAAVAHALPCIFLNRNDGDPKLPARIARRLGVSCTPLGTFDGNRLPKHSRRYRDEFIYQAFLWK